MPNSVSASASQITILAAPAVQPVEQIAIALTPRADLASYAAAVSNPTSPLYRHFLTPSDIVRDYAPDPAVYNKFTSYFQSNGLTIAYTAPNRLLLTVAGTRAQLDAAFGTHSIYGTAHGAVGYVNAAPLQLPASLTPFVAGIAGFDGTAQLHSTIDPVTSRAAIHTNAAGTTVHDPGPVRTAYNVGPISGVGAHNGAGASIAILSASVPNSTNITNYNTYYSGVWPTLTWTRIGPNNSNSASTEAELDLVDAHAAAPSAALRMYIFSGFTGAGLATSISSALSDNVQVLSLSYGWDAESGGDRTALHTELVTAQAQGVPFLVSAGDEGIFRKAADDSVSLLSEPGFSEWPSDDDLATAVGGTFVGIDPTTNAWTSETGWNCGNTDGSHDLTCLRSAVGGTGGSGGGGLQPAVGQPAYQTGHIPDPGTKFGGTGGVGEANYTTKRATPDISTNADPNSGIIFQVTTNFVYYGGGTSAATPWLAGLVADMYQASGATAQVGFLNNKIYTDCLTSHLSWCYDVTSGYNGESAGSGWDYVTGSGSVKDASALFATVEASTATTYTGPTNATYNSPVTLSGHLANTSVPGPIAGETLTLSFGTQSCTGVTNGSGDASCTINPITQAGGFVNALASFAGDTTYLPSSGGALSSISKASQTINFTNPGTHTYGDAPFGLVASASSGLTVSFSIASGPCSVLGSTLTITGAGTCVVNADQSGNSFYQAAPQVQASFVINKAATTTVVTSNLNPAGIGQTVTFTAHVASTAGTPPGVVDFYDNNGATFIGSGTLDGSGNATFSTSSLAAGTHLIDSAYQGSANYLSSVSPSISEVILTCSVSAFLLEGTHGSFNASVAGKPGIVNTNFMQYVGPDGSFHLGSTAVVFCANPGTVTGSVIVNGVVTGTPTGSYHVGDHVTVSVLSSGTGSKPEVDTADSTNGHTATLLSYPTGVAHVSVVTP